MDSQGDQGKRPGQGDDKKGRGMQEGWKDDEGRNREAEEPDRQDEDLKRPVKVGQGRQRGEEGLLIQKCFR